MHLSSENAAWLEQFRLLHGRSPRVLHIGNIANNAFLNSKFLRAAGIESDVLCYDYYHCMGNPEWEETSFIGAVEDANHPAWYALDTHGYERPRWFVQGPIDLCLAYLDAQNAGKTRLADRFWGELAIANRTKLPSPTRRLIHKVSRSSVVRALRILFHGVRGPAILARLLLVKLRFRENAQADSSWNRRIREFPLRVCRAALSALAGLDRAANLAGQQWEAMYEVLASSAAQFSPDGEADRLKRIDIEPYVNVLPRFQRTFEDYDLVHAYATDGLYPMLAHKPYVAYEHGTIRSIPFEDTSQGRLCALSYRLADNVVITNADNLVAAERLGLKQFSFVPHPVNDQMVDVCASDFGRLRKSLCTELDSDFLVFHPARQHWEEQRHPNWEKGNDLLIKAFAQFVKTENPRAAAIFVEWGATVDQSKALLTSLGVADRVKWIAPVAHMDMMGLIGACDVLADQFYLGAFGTTMPKALAFGRPALIYLNEELHRRCFPEMPPVLNVRTVEEIHAALVRIYRDVAYRQELSVLGKQWYSRWHSSERVADKLIAIYRGILGS
jgi:glycosyltransferase involved in cell wall biosynthesis